MNKVLDHVYRALMALSFIDGDKLRVELENAVKELEKENANSGYPLLGEVREDVQELFSAITNYMLLTSHCHVIDAQERLSNAMQKVGEHFA